MCPSPHGLSLTMMAYCMETDIEKLMEMQKELRDTKAVLKEIKAERDATESQLQEATDTLELVSLDKEVAEEKADNLQQEANALKERLDEMEVTLDVYKKGKIRKREHPRKIHASFFEGVCCQRRDECRRNRRGNSTTRQAE